MSVKSETPYRFLSRGHLHGRPDQPSEQETPGSFALPNTVIGIAAAAFLTLIIYPSGASSERSAISYAGLFILILILLFLFYLDIRRYRGAALLRDTRRMVLIAALLVMAGALAQAAHFIYVHLADSLNVPRNTAMYALPVASGAMLISLLFDFHLALAFSFAISILLGIAFPDEPLLPLYYFPCNIVAALQVIRCKKRSAVIRAGGWTILVAICMALGIDLYRGAFIARGAYDLVAACVGAISVVMIVSVLLPFLETVFDIATDIKLLELLDPNHPLQKQLMFKTPGTYHHSILIGNLAEAASEAIGTNPILARVAAYYHDVGKIRKPEYFIENQRVNENKHDHLQPSMSSLIIAAHVKEGVEIAREQRLPAAIIDIIQQHHGTSLINYFYHKAREQHPLAQVPEDDYRYPGPRPRTKTAAIIMLADNVEAAARALDDPTPERIEALTKSVITRILLDDQLSLCDLTLMELRTIAASFNLILAGIYHHRIDYPGLGLPGDKKQHDHQDKKQSEETEAAVGGSQAVARAIA